jgi:uridine phosphorylase
LGGFIFMEKFLESELIINTAGEIYHLGLAPENLADKIIVVGDQDRVDVVAGYFDTITYKSQHREFAVQTGYYQSKRITVLSTGIGTDNIDIVLNELDALVNIDFETRQEKSEKKSLEIVRIGTCGILQADIPVDSFLLSTHALGIDNLGHFYQLNMDSETTELLQNIQAQISLPEKVIPYLTPSDAELTKRLVSNETFTGITVTSSGFYGPQGRKLRLPLQVDNMVDSFSDFSWSGQRIINLEMECSALFALSKNLGHRATGICLGLANRKRKEFTKNYESRIRELISYVLDRI